MSAQTAVQMHSQQPNELGMTNEDQHLLRFLCHQQNALLVCRSSDALGL